MEAIVVNQSPPPPRRRIRKDATEVFRTCLTLKPGEWIGLTGENAKYATNGFGMWRIGKHSAIFAKLNSYSAGNGVVVIVHGPMPEAEYVSRSVLVHSPDEPPPRVIKAHPHSRLFDWMRVAKAGETIAYTSDDDARYVGTLVHNIKRRKGGEFKTKTLDPLTLHVRCIVGANNDE